jgi:hypothetical protein
MSTIIRAALLGAGAFVTMTASASAWDYPGHRMVGAIADFVLSSRHPEAYKKIQNLIVGKDADGNKLTRTLSQVATSPDCAKPGNVPYCGRTPSDEEKDYAAGNKHNADYHFTDVPIQQTRYVAGSPGTGKNDAVQMINYTIAQLRGKSPQKEDVKLTDAQALWLLVHLVGDIHQPLHVGSIYFDKATCKQIKDPTVSGGMDTVASTIGGNAILLDALAPDPAAPPADNFHLFWDSTIVNNAMQAAGWPGAEQDFARLLASKAPPYWQTAGDPESWAEKWVADIMPTARAAHDKLKIEFRKRDPAHHDACVWQTQISPSYGKWASQQARNQIQKAGFRLAALLNEIFKP